MMNLSTKSLLSTTTTTTVRMSNVKSTVLAKYRPMATLSSSSSSLLSPASPRPPSSWTGANCHGCHQNYLSRSCTANDFMNHQRCQQCNYLKQNRRFSSSSSPTTGTTYSTTPTSVSKTDQILMDILHLDHDDSEGSRDDEDFETDETNSSCNIVKITLNRPKANAMGKEFMFGFQNILSYLEEEPQQNQSSHQDSSSPPRCVVIASSSPKVFCAGADLKERSQMKDLKEVDEYVTMLRTTLQRLSELPMPVITSISGVAVGGGLELALAADIRLCSPDATFGAPESKLAIIPGAGGTQRLPRLVGTSRAKELIWTGRRVDAKEAYRIGLVEEVVGTGNAYGGGGDADGDDPSSVDDRAIELAFDIARSSGPVAIRAAKEAIDYGMKELNMKDALNVERRCYAKTLPTQDRLEGLAAFKEGRRPLYKGH